MKLLYEFKEVFGDDEHQEVQISRLKDENDNLQNPDYTVTLSSYNNDGKYYAISKPEDVDGDNDSDEDDASYYEMAAKLVTDLLTLSSMDSKKLFARILIRFKQGSKTAVEILHFKPGNTEIHKPDDVVTATNPDSLGRYTKIEGVIDADGDGDEDANDQLIYRNLATSFVSMKSLPQ
ncbi:hypothetical protein [Pseudomonas sp. S1_E04]